MKQKILCVDDEEAVVNFMKLFLSKHYEVHTARSGQEAIETFEREGPFNVVLSDVQMPNMSGVELIPKLHDVRPTTVCVLLTGHSDFTLVQELLDSGKVYKYIVKPVLPKTLLEVIDEAIQSADAQPAAASE
jgi:YesN/AraC family two-component response regulator